MLRPLRRKEEGSGRPDPFDGSLLAAALAGAVLLLVAVHGRLDQLLGLGLVDGAVDLGLLVLQGLVDAEEVAHLVDQVLGEVLELLDALVVGISLGYCDDLLVVVSSVDHQDSSDGAALDEGEGGDGLGAEDEGIQGVPVVGVGPGNESVAGGVVGGCGQDPVESEHPGVLVQLVFGLASLGDLYDHGEALGCDERRVDVMEDVGHL